MFEVNIPATYTQICFHTNPQYIGVSPQIYTKFGSGSLRTYQMVRCWVEQTGSRNQRTIFMVAKSEIGKFDFVYGQRIRNTGIVDMVDHRWIRGYRHVDDVLTVFNDEFRFPLMYHEVIRTLSK